MYHMNLYKMKTNSQKNCETNVTYECYRFLYDKNDFENNDISSKIMVTGNGVFRSFKKRFNDNTDVENEVENDDEF